MHRVNSGCAAVHRKAGTDPSASPYHQRMVLQIAKLATTTTTFYALVGTVCETMVFHIWTYVSILILRREKILD